MTREELRHELDLARGLAIAAAMQLDCDDVAGAADTLTDLVRRLDEARDRDRLAEEPG